MDSEVRHCAMKFCEERRLAQAAHFPEAAEIHRQMAMLYKAQFLLLKSRLRRSSIN